MRLHALLSWYQEDPAWLDRAIRALERAGVSHVIAIDGAYALYPRARNRSGIAQHEAITRASYQIGAGLTIHVPPAPWAGNEIEKRTFMFQLADHLSEPGDWHLILDADEVITAAPDDLHQRLQSSIFDVAQVTFSEPHPTGRRREYPIPILFRAGLGVHVETNHYTYVTDDGRKLWGNATTDRLEPRLDLADTFKLDHLTEFRHQDRRTDAKRYYADRAATGEEQGDCAFCSRPATVEVTHEWKPADGGYAANWVNACNKHGKELIAKSRAFLASQGLDPDRVQIEIRSGPAPDARQHLKARVKTAA